MQTNWPEELSKRIIDWQRGRTASVYLMADADQDLPWRLQTLLQKSAANLTISVIEPMADWPASAAPITADTAQPAPAMLVVCLDLPAGSEKTALQWCNRLAQFAPEVLFAVTAYLENPIAHADLLAAWLAALAQAGFVYAHADHQDEDGPGFLLRHDPRPSSEHVAELTWLLAQQRDALHRLYAQSVLQDRSRALLLHQAVRAENEIQRLTQRLEEQAVALKEWHALKDTPGYQLMRAGQRLRAMLAPPNTLRERGLETLLGWARIYQERGWYGLRRHFQGELAWRTRSITGRRRKDRLQPLLLEPRIEPPPVQPHHESVDIVICIHNALEDVKVCLEAVLAHTQQPFRLVLVDDGSDATTHAFLRDFVGASEMAELLHSATATGYTFAANRGLRHSTADYVVLLNSDAVVTAGWLDHMIACANTAQDGERPIGMVGPLSNTASWQSIPQIEQNGDWASNPIPAGFTLASWATAVTDGSARLYPPMPLLNGFCLLIRRKLIDEIGYFDEDRFGEGYGEENDYALRARKAGWSLALADDAYVFHAQSRSYSHERRRVLSERAGEALAAKHGQALIDRSVDYCLHAPVLEGIRARSAVLAERHALVQQGKRRFQPVEKPGARRSVLIALPVDSPGGGANVVINESLAMQKMGVDVTFFNTPARRTGFEGGYPDLQLPVIYAEEDELPRIGRSFDAVVATYYPSVYWMRPLARRNAATEGPILGYYIQDYEVLFFDEESPEYEKAKGSYTAVPGLRCFTKTAWNQRTVAAGTGVTPAVVGPSVDLDLFCPYPKMGADPRNDAPRSAPLHVVAMVRPPSINRAPALTMSLLRDLHLRFGSQVQITIFGVERQDPGLAALPQNFPCRLAGIVDSRRVARLLADADIFVDFSTYQAMGLTAMEAMAAGCAVIVPMNGGATSFAQDEENALVVDTGSRDACWNGLMRLMTDDPLRRRLQRNAIRSICRFYPEQAAYNILDLLFERH